MQFYEIVIYNSYNEIFTGSDGCSKLLRKMDEEIPVMAEEEQMENETSHKKVRHRKKHLYNAIRKQMEFYFGDVNLAKDRFMAQLLREDSCTEIDISIFLRFNKIRALTTDARDIASALRNSDLLSVTEDGKKVFRTAPFAPKENADDCTVYVEQLPPDTQHDWLKEVFSVYGKVVYISIPKFKSSGKIKGFGFVEFETPEEAKKALEAFGAMGCHLSTQISPEKLCSIATFEPNEGNAQHPPSEEFKQRTNEEAESQEQERFSEKKKIKKKDKLNQSDESKENETVPPEENSENVSSTKLHKNKRLQEGMEKEQNSEVVQSEEIDGSPLKDRKRKKGEDEARVESDKIEQEYDTAEVHYEKKKRKRNYEDAIPPEENSEYVSSTKLHKKKKLQEENEAEQESELVQSEEIDESPPKKRKKKKSEDEERVETDNAEQESDTAEVNAEKKKRKKSYEDAGGKSEENGDNQLPIEEKVDEDGDHQDVVDETGTNEEEMEELQMEGKKRRRGKKKKKRDNRQDADVSRLRILSKKEWKHLRNKYLNLQKEKMKCLKRYLSKNKWNRNYNQGRTQYTNGQSQVKEEVNVKDEHNEVNVGKNKKESEPRLSYTPGVIVHAVLDEPIMDERKFKADARSLSGVEYVDVMMGTNEAYVRCATPAEAENIISLAPWSHTALLEGDEEKKYWDKIFEDRKQKLSSNVRVKQRGRDKILQRAERELGKHIRFDD